MTGKSLNGMFLSILQDMEKQIGIYFLKIAVLQNLLVCRRRFEER